MPVFFFTQERHTLASALRPALEAEAAESDDFVSCTHPHPLDDHIEVHAPDEACVRRALLRVKAQIQAARTVEVWSNASSSSSVGESSSRNSSRRTCSTGKK